MGNSSISGSHFYTRETSHGFPHTEVMRLTKTYPKHHVLPTVFSSTQVPRKASAATINQLVTGESVTREVRTGRQRGLSQLWGKHLTLQNVTKSIGPCECIRTVSAGALKRLFRRRASKTKTCLLPNASERKESRIL